MSLGPAHEDVNISVGLDLLYLFYTGANVSSEFSLLLSESIIRKDLLDSAAMFIKDLLLNELNLASINIPFIYADACLDSLWLSVYVKDVCNIS